MQAEFESLARCFSLLGEPTRLRLLHALCQDERCVNDLIQATGLTQANASRHLGLMYQVGMLSRRRDGPQIFYKLADPMYTELCRTVSVRLHGRTEQALASSEQFSHFGDDMGPRGLPYAFDSCPSPAPQKETARV